MNKLSLEDLILSAKTLMLFKYPFLGHMAISMEFIESKEIPTAATDGVRIYWNRSFFEGLTKKQIVFIIAHEILHAVYEHVGRRKSRDPGLWNMAVDYVVNSTIIEEINKKAMQDGTGIATMPEGGLLSDKYTHEMSADEVYVLLQKSGCEVQMPLDTHLDENGQPNGGKSGSGTEPGSVPGVELTADTRNGLPSLNEQEMEAIRDKVREMAMNAMQAAGDAPEGIKRALNNLIEPKLDWRELIDLTITSMFSDDYTYAKPSRRSGDNWGRVNSIIRPGVTDGEMVEAVCAIDASGSMSDEQIRDLLSEIQGIMSMFDNWKLTLMTFDADVYNVEEFTPKNVYDFNKYVCERVYGGGGTSFEKVYEYIRKNMDPTPEKLIMFTDGMPNYGWGDPDLVDTLFVIHYPYKHNPPKPPFGQYAYYE